MKELDAINSMLRLIGSSPVNSVDTKLPDVVDARDMLKQTSAQMQSSRWWFNTDYSVLLVRELDKRIQVPEFVTEITAEDRNVIMRDGHLYDKDHNTYQFDMDIMCDTLSTLAWESLPIKAKFFILYQGSADFVRDSIGDTQKVADLLRKAEISMMELNKSNITNSRVNVLDRQRVLRARAGFRPYHRGGVRFYGDV